jgi:GT2 family glycosyltransferase
MTHQNLPDPRTTTVYEVGIIIVNYHSALLVHRCVASLREHLQATSFIILVDNSEPTELHALPHSTADLIHISAHRNAGFAAGCNLGLAEVRRRKIPFALLLNPDTRAESDFLSPLLDLARHEPTLGALAPTILHDDGSKTTQFAGGRNLWCRGGPKHYVASRPLPPRGWHPDAFLTGAALLLNMAAVERTGAMREEYFLYFEDADYIQSLRAAGYMTAYVPARPLYHALSSTTGLQSPLHVYYFSRNRIIFLRRWSPRLCFWYYMTFTTLVKLPGAIIVFGLVRRQWNLTWSFFRGYRDGIRHVLSRDRLELPTYRGKSQR